MSEIDKLINQAFPDELRDIEPISVDEDAILARTLGQLGLEPPEKPELPVYLSKPLLWHTEQRAGGEKGEPELVEAPVVVHHRWVDWAGWAIAACLVLVCAVNWGPWLIDNLDFGIGPRSMGNEMPVEDESSQMTESSTNLKAKNSYNISVRLSTVTYEEEKAVVTLFFTIMGSGGTDLNLDQFDISMKSIGSREVTRVSRSNTEQQVALEYELGGARQLVLTVRQLVPLQDNGGNDVGFAYQIIEELSMDLDSGVADSNISGKHFEFPPYGVAMPPASNE